MKRDEDIDLLIVALIAFGSLMALFLGMTDIASMGLSGAVTFLTAKQIGLKRLLQEPGGKIDSVIAALIFVGFFMYASMWLGYSELAGIAMGCLVGLLGAK